MNVLDLCIHVRHQLPIVYNKYGIVEAIWAENTVAMDLLKLRKLSGEDLTGISVYMTMMTALNATI